MRLWGLAERGAALKPPIFILGNVRSGTSLLANLVSAHPSTVMWHEPRTLWLYADPGRPHDEFDESDASERVARYIRRRFLRYQQRHGGLRVVERTPQNVLKIRYVRAIFPEATYLYIVRNPLSYVSSVEGKWQKAVSLRRMWRRFRETPTSQVPYYLRQILTDQFNKRVLRRKYIRVFGTRYRGIFDDLEHLDVLTVAARQWSICSRVAERDLGLFEPGRVLRIRYEDLVNDPLPHLERICGHCGVVPTPEMRRMAEEVVDPARQDKWKRFQPAQVMAVLPELQDEMKRHGYAVPAELQRV